jgi:hypothetical protein
MNVLHAPYLEKSAYAIRRVVHAQVDAGEGGEEEGDKDEKRHPPLEGVRMRALHDREAYRERVHHCARHRSRRK